jgi:O-antigen/teichoic acid export membrane protein
MATQVTERELPVTGLRDQVARGLGWKLVSQVSNQLTQSTVGIILARLLIPHDFGVAGMALVFSGFISILTDVSLGAAIIQRKLVTELDRSTVFWTTVAVGGLFAAGGVAVSPLVADFFSTPQVKPLVAALSIGFLVTAVGQTQTALLTREMQFRSLELRGIAANLAGAAAGIGLAVGGFGPWAIVGQSLCSGAVSSVLLWFVSPWRPQLVYSFASLRSLGSFGMKTFFSRILVYLNFQGDNLLVGRYLGSAPLGAYTVAYNVMYLPISRVTTPASNVLYTAFSRIQDDARRMGEAWLRVNLMTAALLVPASLGLAVTASDFVPVVFGQRWHAAAPVLAILSLGGVAQSLQMFNGPVYQACGKPGLFLRFMFFSTTVTFGGFVIGIHWGLLGVAASFAIARNVVLVANTRLICKTVALDVSKVVRSYVRVVFLAVVMALVVLGLKETSFAAALPAGLRLVLLVAVGIVVYVLLIVWRLPEIVRELQSAFGRVFVFAAIGRFASIFKRLGRRAGPLRRGRDQVAEVED